MDTTGICPLCGKPMDSAEHIAEQWVLREIQKEHPDWIESNGLCTKCIAYYRSLDNVFELDEQEN